MPVQVRVPQPYPVTVDRPYPVHYDVPRPVEVKSFVPVDRPVPVVINRQVEIQKPYPVPQVFNHEKHLHIHPEVHFKSIQQQGWQGQGYAPAHKQW